MWFFNCYGDDHDYYYYGDNDDDDDDDGDDDDGDDDDDDGNRSVPKWNKYSTDFYRSGPSLILHDLRAKFAKSMWFQMGYLEIRWQIDRFVYIC